MLVFLRYNLAFLATPKTGSTAVEMALRNQAEIVFAKGRKHIPAARYANKIAPFLEDTFGQRPESVAVMRAPVDQLRSWYKYRNQPRHAGTAQSTAEISFDQYAIEAMSDDPPERAQTGTQFGFLTDGEGRLRADHVFAYEQWDQFDAFLSARLGTEIALSARNASPARPAPISPAVEAQFRHARAGDFALYEAVLEAGGHLKAPGRRFAS